MNELTVPPFVGYTEYMCLLRTCKLKLGFPLGMRREE
jgi:hypothetical protein